LKSKHFKKKGEKTGGKERKKCEGKNVEKLKKLGTRETGEKLGT